MKKRSIKKGALAGSMLLAASLLSGCAPKEPVCVYGPPEYFDPTEAPFYTEDILPQPEYGPPIDEDWDYDPAFNEPVCVYGPPPIPEGAEVVTEPAETEAQP